MNLIGLTPPHYLPLNGAPSLSLSTPRGGLEADDLTEEAWDGLNGRPGPTQAPPFSKLEIKKIENQN